jgi:hypothetical protein
MRAKSIVAAAAFVVVLTYALSAGAEPSESPEVRRIRSHFDSVLAELSERDTRDLTAVQRAHRASVTETLKRYKDRGVFPNNYDFPGQPTPYFVDRKTGTLCAVAHLLESAGRRDIVDRVARANNNVWVAELAGDSALGTWLAANGLTLDEAARIQVPYDFAPVPIEQAAAPASRFQRMSGVALSGASAVTLLNAWSNRDGHGRIRNVLGIASGVASTSVGVMMLSDRPAQPSMGIANVAVGALSAYLSTRGVFRHRQLVSAEREAQRARLNVAPVVSSTEGAGVAISLRF